jgi:hypothetical protein
MLLALRGHWGTHYDALPPDYAAPTSFFSQYMVIAFLPQMVVWIAFTILVGALIGTLVTAVRALVRTLVTGRASCGNTKPAAP